MSICSREIVAQGLFQGICESGKDILNDPEKVHEFTSYIEKWMREEIDGFVPDRVMAKVGTRDSILTLSWRITASHCGEKVHDFWAEGMRDPAEVIVSAFKDPRWPDNLK